MESGTEEAANTSKHSLEDIPELQPQKVRVVQPDDPLPEQRTPSSDTPCTPIRNVPARAHLNSSPVLSSPAHTPPIRAAAAEQSLTVAPPEKIRRLVIEKLVLIDFKSYGERREIGPFNTSFSAVVGPNGSGKSNVIDALLFVFGFRATKMRHDKLGGLIHQSENYRPQQCRVEVHFKDVEDVDGVTREVPDSKLVVARTATFKNFNGKSKDATSQYWVNDRRCQYSEVRDLLMGRGIDLQHKRFLILQGEVENIAMMKPKAETEYEDGLLEYLEDIIGTAAYKTRISELEPLIEGLEEDSKRKHSDFVFASKDYENSNADRVEIRTFYEKFNNYSIAYHKSLQLEIHKLEARHRTCNDELQDLHSQLDEVVVQHREAKARISELTKQEQVLAKTESQQSHAQAQFQQALKKITTQRAKYEETKQHLDTRKGKVEKKISSATKEKEIAESFLESFKNQMESLLKVLAITEEDLEKEESALADMRTKMKSQTDPITSVIEQKQKEVEPWRAQIQSKQAEVQSIDQQLAMSMEEVERLSTQTQELKEKQKQLSLGGNKAASQHKSCKAELTKLEGELREVEESHNQVSQELHKARSVYEEERQAYSAATQSQSNTQYQNKMVTELMKQTGRIPGLYGRLGSLGRIDDVYDIAVSTACPRLDDFVCADTKSARQCIEFLRANNLGRATFISLDKLRNPLPRSNYPQNVKRLYDLIEPKDDIFRPAFYLATGDTLVAKNMDQARAVAFGGNRRYKTVTMDGKIVEVSGAMSGGGQPIRGRMSSSLPKDTINARELDSLKRTMEASRVKVEELEKQRKVLSDRLEELNEKIPELQVSKEKLGATVDTMEVQFKELQTVRKDVKARSAAATEQLEQFQKDFGVKKASLEKEITKLSQSSRKLESEIKDLQAQIADIGGLELKQKVARVQDLRALLKVKNQERAEKDSTRQKMLKTLQNQTQQIEEATNDMKYLLLEEKELEKNLVDTAEMVKETRANAENATAELQETRQRLADIKNATSDAKSEFSESEKKELQLSKKVNDTREKISSIEGEIQSANTTKANLKLHDMSMVRDLTNPEEDLGTFEFDELSPDDLDALNKEELLSSIREFDQEKRNSPTDIARKIDDYKKSFDRYKQAKDTYDAAYNELKAAQTERTSLLQRRRDEFQAGLDEITSHLNGMYCKITGGNPNCGASLEPVDRNDLFEGINFTVMPPGKTWKHIGTLSGGEKTLSSLALVFALHEYKPTPLYVMDEIDAALDYKNVSIIGEYIRNRTSHGQFIVISLRNNMFELASRMIGIYKYSNMSKSVCFDPGNARV